MSSGDAFQQSEAISPSSINNIPPIHHLPNEILSRIFHLGIHSPGVTTPSELWWEYRTIAICQYLRAFLGVCSRWRQIALQTSDIWSIVPIIEYPPGQYTFPTARLSAQNAAGRNLRLIAFLNESRPEINKVISKVWKPPSSRFEAVDLYGNCEDTVVAGLNRLLWAKGARDTKTSLRELSLCWGTFHDGKLSRPAQPGLAYGDVTGITETTSRWFINLLKVVQVLRFCGSCMYFRDLSLGMLTEIRVQNMVFEEHLSLHDLFVALVSAPQLRKLEIISVLSYHSLWPIEPKDELSISFPNLQYLYLEDLNSDAIIFVLNTITPGSHVTTLNWTDRCYTRATTERRRVYESLVLTFDTCKIDVLMLRQEPGVSFSDEKVHSLLQAIPTITTLYLDSVYLDSKVLYSLIPLEQAARTSTGETSPKQNHDAPAFPKLKNLYISRSHCHDLSALRDLSVVAANHNLQELGIGIGSYCDCYDADSDSPPHYNQTKIDAEMERVWSSLAGSVPRLTRLSGDPSSMPPHLGFESRIWQLW